MSNSSDDNSIRWFVMRDLKRPNALQPAWKMLPDAGFEVFTPMHTVLVDTKCGRRRATRPVIPDLLFVRASRQYLDPVVASTPTLQYRFLRNARCKPMTVPESDMDRFIHAVTSTEAPRYFRPDEITPAMIGNAIEIIGGPLNGYKGNLLKLRGAKKRRLIVNLPDIFSVAVEVSPEFIRILNLKQ